jgi:hypothetical protein
MKHTNRSSQTHSKISLQRFEMGEARDVCERVGGVSQVGIEFKSCSLLCGEESGRGIFRWGFKTSRWADFAA